MLLALVAITLAAGFDAATLAAVIAGITGLIAGAGSYLVQRRDVQTKADANYVERNLAAMQAIIDRQAEENAHLRLELDQCKRACDECLTRVKTLERRRPRTNG